MRSPISLRDALVAVAHHLADLVEGSAIDVPSPDVPEPSPKRKSPVTPPRPDREPTEMERARARRELLRAGWAPKKGDNES